MKREYVWFNEVQDKKLAKIAEKADKSVYAVIKEAVIEKYPELV
jgi:hypothetical protein